MNRESYTAIAKSWDDARSSITEREQPYIEAFLSGFPVSDARPIRLLDLGCGTGRPIAEHVLSLGFQVVGVDQSEGQLEIAAARFPRDRYPLAEWRLASIESFTTRERFDGIVCWDALFHIPREHHESIFQKIHELLVDDGRLMMTVGGSGHSAFTDTMFGQPFFYDSHTPEIALQMLEEIGLESLVADFINVPTDGRDKGRFAIVARKRGKGSRFTGAN